MTSLTPWFRDLNWSTRDYILSFRLLATASLFGCLDLNTHGPLEPQNHPQKLWGPVSFICCFRFRMVTLSCIISSLDQFATHDFQNTYFHVSNHPAHRKFFCFIVADMHYQFRVLPFNLSTAPLSNACQPWQLFCEDKWFYIYTHLNDWLIQGKSPQRVTNANSFPLLLLDRSQNQLGQLKPLGFRHPVLPWGCLDPDCPRK